jgi:hypothetical protein
MHFEAMSAHAEAVVRSNSFQDSRDFFVAKLDELLALFADEVVVLRVPIIVFVNFTVIRTRNFTNQACLFERTDGPIDCRPADSPTVASWLSQPRDDLIGIEMLVFSEDLANDRFAFLCQTFSLSRQVLSKFFDRRCCDFLTIELVDSQITHFEPQRKR